MDSLLRFAPAYFEYMSKAFFHGVSDPETSMILPPAVLTHPPSIVTDDPRQNLWFLYHQPQKHDHRENDANRCPGNGGEFVFRAVLEATLTNHLQNLFYGRQLSQVS